VARSFRMRIAKSRTGLRADPSKCPPARPAAVTIAALTFLIALPAAMSATTTGGHDALRVVEVSDRTVCEDSVGPVLTNVIGPTADSMETLQSRYESDVGFRAVVHDSAGPVLVVDRERVQEWAERLSTAGVRVAPSCVPESVVGASREAVKELRVDRGEYVSSGYDALSDAFAITGTQHASLVRAALDAALETLESRETSAHLEAEGIVRIRHRPSSVTVRAEGSTTRHRS
jgi:hypothetical protein